MKDNKLISMTDFVIQQRSELMFKELGKACCKYADFLRQPLKLEMFVPCDDEGNVLEEPKGWSNGECDIYDCCSICCCEQYKKAKEKVLFEDSVLFDKTPFKQTERMMINLNHPATFRIYNKFNYSDGSIQSDFLPNFSEIPTIEYLVSFNLQLTPTAIKQIQP